MYSVEQGWQEVRNRRSRPRMTRSAVPQAVKKGGTEMHNRYQCLCSIEVENDGLDQVTERSEGWERISLKVDSGAIDTVIPRGVAAHVPVQETSRSRSGAGFRAANGSRIEHYGQKEIQGYSDEYQGVNLKAQVAEVKSALGSVSQMIKAGNRVHFEAGNCYVENITTGKITPMVERNGMFEIGIWVFGGVPGVPDGGAQPDFARQGKN